MATINVSTNSNLSSVAYANGDTIEVLDGVTLTVNSAWGALKPYIIRALGTGQINISNTSTTTPILLDFNVTAGGAPRLQAEQNGKITIRGNWITVATSTGAANQTLFNPTNVGGVNMGYPTKVQVETASGSGIYEDWLVLPEYVAGGNVNTYGFNSVYYSTGTVAVSSGGVVTGTGTTFNTNWVGARFRAAGMSSDYEITSVTSTTVLQLRDIDTASSAYTGPTIAAGATYNIELGVLVERKLIGNQENGKILFFNPLTSVVSTGDNTNGNTIPAGCKVRVPNIVLDAAPLTMTLNAAITNSATSLQTTANGVNTPSSNAAYVSSTQFTTLLLVEGSNCERIHYTSRSGNVYSGLTRGAYMTTAAAFTTAAQVVVIPGLGSGSCCLWTDLDTSGTIDGEIFQGGLRCYLNFTNPYAVRLKDFGALRFQISGCPNAVEIDGVSLLSESFTLPGVLASSHTFANNLGPGFMKNIKAISTCSNVFASGTTNTLMQFTNLPSFTEFSNFHLYALKRNTSASGVTVRNMLLQLTNPDALYKDFYTYGGNLFFSTLTNVTVEGIYFADFMNNTSSALGANFPLYVALSTNCTFRKFRTILGGKPPLSSTVQTENTCAGILIHNKGYPAIEGAGKIAVLLSDQAADTVMSHFTVNNPRITTVSVYSGNVVSAKGGTVRRIKCDSVNSFLSATGFPVKGNQIVDVTSGPYRFFSTTATSAVVPNLSDVQPIIVVTNNGTLSTGQLIVGPYSSQSSLDMYSTTGTPYLDNIGRYYLPTIGDSVIVKSTFPLKAVTGFDTSASWNLRSPNTGLLANNTQLPNITTEFRMSNWGTPNTGAWTAFTSMTDLQNAFTALSGYSSNIGLDFQVRYTCTASGTGQFIMQSLFPVTLDAAYDPAVHYSKYTVSGIQSGSNVGFTNTSTSALFLNDSTASGTKTFQLDYDFDSSNIPYRLDVRKPGYTFVNTSGTFNQASQSLPITQLQVLNTAGSALYISGLDSSGFTVNHTTQKITVTSNMTTEQLWSKIQDHLCLTANLTRADFFSTSNGSSYTCTYDLEINNCTLSGNGSISMPSKVVTFVGTGAATVPITDSTGTKVNLVISNIVPNSRIQIYNTTDSTEIYNAVVTGTSLSLLQTWTANKNIRIRATYCVGTTAYHPYQTSGVLSSLGLNVALSQALDTVYNGIGIDGTTVTECAADYPNVQIDINDPDGVTSVQRIYAWYHSIEYTAQGIANFFMGLDSTDGANFTVDTSVLDLKLDNRSASPVRIIGGYLSRNDGATVIAASSNSIQMDPSKAYIANADSITSKLDKTLTTAKFLALK